MTIRFLASKNPYEQSRGEDARVHIQGLEHVYLFEPLEERQRTQQVRQETENSKQRVHANPDNKQEYTTFMDEIRRGLQSLFGRKIDERVDDIAFKTKFERINIKFNAPPNSSLGPFV